MAYLVPVMVAMVPPSAQVALGRVNVGGESYSYRVNDDGSYTLLGNRREMKASKAVDGTYKLSVVKGPALRNVALRVLKVVNGRLITTR